MMVTKRIVTLLVIGLAILAAFYQARGVNALVRATHATGHSSHELPSLVFAGRQQRAHGPLFGAEPTVLEAPESSSGTAPDVCEDIQVKIFSEREEPGLSLVSLVFEGRTLLRPVGGRVGARILAAVGPHPASLLPTAWFEGEDSCHVSLHAGKPRTGDLTSPSKRTSKTTSVSRASRGIQKVAEGEYLVDSALFEDTLRDPTEFARTVQVVPIEGKGLRIQRITRGAPLELLGVRRGDVLEELNGSSLADPTQLLNAYARLARAEVFELRLNRSGARRSIEVRVR